MKKIIWAISILMAVALMTGCNTSSMSNNIEDGAEIKSLPNLLSHDIDKVKIAKMAFENEGDSTIRNIEIEPTDKQVEEIIKWYNSIIPDRIASVNTVDGSIVLGIVFELKNKDEIRIQYNSEKKIYLTISNPSITYYEVKQPEIKAVFEELLQ